MDETVWYGLYCVNRTINHGFKLVISYKKHKIIQPLLICFFLGTCTQKIYLAVKLSSAENQTVVFCLFSLSSLYASLDTSPVCSLMNIMMFTRNMCSSLNQPLNHAGFLEICIILWITPKPPRIYEINLFKYEYGKVHF
jgi:hypothetical protein